MKKTRIFLVEDHQIFLEALISLLEQHEQLEIVGFEDNAHRAIKHINELVPDVLIADLSMPLLNGEQLINVITKRNPDIKSIVLTMHKSDDRVRSSLDAGAKAYVLKDDTHQDLITAIHSVMQGKSYLSPGICNNIVHGYLDSSVHYDTDTCKTEILTNRECQIIKLIAEGKSNTSIASLLSISSKTVEKHRSNIMKKLNLHNTASLTKYAIENNYL